MPTAETALDRAEGLAERLLPNRTPKRRMLVIVNPYATTVSDRLRNLVVYALGSRYAVEAIDTQERGHAMQICSEAASEGYDVVVAFGGDGTVNEAAHGLAGSDTPLSVLPGGSTNVYCRVLGIPNEIVDATEHLLRLADDWQPRRVDLGLVNGRHFTFSAGLGLDASVVERVDAHPYRKAKFGEWYFTWAALAIFTRRYLFDPPLIDVGWDDQTVRGVTLIVQNAHPYTYFNRRPIEIAEGAELDSGTLAGAVLRRASPVDMPTVIWRALTKRPRMVNHRQVTAFDGVTDLEGGSPDGGPIPLQVDGDYIGEVDRVRFGIAAGALLVVA
ncbi:MAG: diacylglycerol/lipid kinase family protein [Solirubrobacteraceae bacterium]